MRKFDQLSTFHHHISRIQTVEPRTSGLHAEWHLGHLHHILFQHNLNDITFKQPGCFSCRMASAVFSSYKNRGFKCQVHFTAEQPKNWCFYHYLGFLKPCNIHTNFIYFIIWNCITLHNFGQFKSLNKLNWHVQLSTNLNRPPTCDNCVYIFRFWSPAQWSPGKYRCETGQATERCKT